MARTSTFAGGSNGKEGPRSASKIAGDHGVYAYIHTCFESNSVRMS